ncbi:MAG: cation-transporting P-type ATPase [Clostridia bacterium]|nr:cation-transporting P-type ATPase [Clostridia bacterium]
MKNEKWFAKELAQVELQLKTNAATGLSRKAARSRVSKNTGQLFLLPTRSLPKLLLELCSDFSWIVLSLLALLSLFFEEFQSAAMVLVLSWGNLLSVGLFILRSYKSTDASASFFHPVVRVIRGGKLFRVGFRNLVPGDVILVEEGDMLCCDARLVTSDDLEVSMRVDQNRFITRKKMASAHIPAEEHRPWEMSNMLHAGSVVLRGNGRAIVTAVGRYTYLGALTGGIELPVSRQIPEPLLRMRGVCSRTNMILLIAVIPFSLISFFASLFGGGTVLLSAAFFTALSLVATTMSQLTCSLCRLFYTHQIRCMLAHPYGGVVRSPYILDQLASADYVFMMDGGAVTDGVLHFSAAMSAEGEIRNYRASSTVGYFAELASLYTTAATRTVTTGLSGSGSYLRGIREFIQASGVDEGALTIRCSILSYAPGNLSDGAERVSFCDRGNRFFLQVSYSSRLIDECSQIMLGGVKQPMGEEGKQSLLRARDRYVVNHRLPLIFTVTSECCPNEHCFVGMVVLREGVDPQWKKHLGELNRAGCRVITFVPSDEKAPKIPEQITQGRCVAKEEFIKRKLPVTENFGRFACYSGMSEEDVLSLIRLVHDQKRKVWIMGMTDAVIPLADEADGVISYAPVYHRKSADSDEEILTRETAGQRSSTSCSQVVKDRADLLIPRPSPGKGGLASLAYALRGAQLLQKKLAMFWRYLIWIQWIRVIVVGFPMLLGRTVLDARHVLLLCCVLDGFALAAILLGRESQFPRKKSGERVRFEPGWAEFRNNRALLLASALAAVSILLLPEWVGLLGWIGRYLYPTEFCVTALLFLHLTVLIWLRYEGGDGRLKTVFQDVPLIASAGFVLLFLVLCGLWEPFGTLFGFEKNPIPYIFVALIPSAVFATVSWILTKKR